VLCRERADKEKFAKICIVVEEVDVTQFVDGSY